MAINQAYLFLIFTINGVLIGFLFDIFRVLRKSFNTNDLITYIEDIIFWILSGVIILYSMCKFCDGELRGYTIIGISVGLITYILLISTYVVKIFVFIINILKIILKKILMVLIYPFKIILKPISLICINIRQGFLKSTNKIYKNETKNEKCKKTLLKKGILYKKGEL